MIEWIQRLADGMSERGLRPLALRLPPSYWMELMQEVSLHRIFPCSTGIPENEAVMNCCSGPLAIILTLDPMPTWTWETA